MKKLVCCLIGLIMFIPACVTTTPPPVPDNCQNSIIMNKIPEWKEVDILLQLGNLEALKNDVYTKQQALDAITDLENILKDPNATYADFLVLAINKIRWVNEHAGAEVFIVSQYFNDFNKNIVIDPCDRDILMKHLMKQRKVVALVNQD